MLCWFSVQLFDFGMGHDLRVVGLSPSSVSVLSTEFVCLSPSASPTLLMLSHSLSPFAGSLTSVPPQLLHSAQAGAIGLRVLHPTRRCLSPPASHVRPHCCGPPYPAPGGHMQAWPLAPPYPLYPSSTVNLNSFLLV